jgi:enoyl-CoA hydratase/carnithine racemase
VREEYAGGEVLCEVDDHVALVTLNRPERSNALSRAMKAEIPRLMTQLSADRDVRVVAFRGAGEKTFCAGADLKEVAEVDGSDGSLTPMTGQMRNLFEAILECEKPTIALINGPAVAGGMELSLACDMRIAADHAWFSMPEAALGMGANFASAILPKLIPRALALEMLYTASRITAVRAAEIGLINRVIPRDQLQQEGLEFARGIAANAPLTVQRYKAMTQKTWEMPIPSALRLNVGPNPYQSNDRAEGVRARLEKRKPNWRGM